MLGVEPIICYPFNYTCDFGGSSCFSTEKTEIETNNSLGLYNIGLDSSIYFYSYAWYNWETLFFTYFPFSLSLSLEQDLL